MIVEVLCYVPSYIVKTAAVITIIQQQVHNGCEVLLRFQHYKLRHIDGEMIKALSSHLPVRTECSVNVH